MTYSLAFVDSALKEWRKLAPALRTQFKNKLRERLDNPHVVSARLHGLADCYKIKLRSAGYRLVYQVDNKVLLVTVIGVGKRENGMVYAAANKRLKK
ncbi:MAG: type II toxin-antitoxin system RelE/ParE family toxin [Rudaea sp.]